MCKGEEGVLQGPLRDGSFPALPEKLLGKMQIQAVSNRAHMTVTDSDGTRVVLGIARTMRSL